MFGITLSFIFAEILARYIPATDLFLLELPIICKNPKSPDFLCLYRRKRFTKGRYIRGKFPPFNIDALKSTNDIGQFSNIDFEALKNNRETQLNILSVGDSYVEALQVNNKDTFHGILNQYKTIDNKKVLSTAIGSSGNAFPQYLVHLFFAKKNMNLESSILIIPIIHNDFDESLEKYNPEYSGGKFKLSSKSNIFFKERFNNKESTLKRFLIKKSYLIRYFILNLKLSEHFHRYPLCLINHKRFCPLKNKISSDENYLVKNNDAIQATEIFFINLLKIRETQRERSNTIFIIDSDRKSLYNNNIPKDKFTDFQMKFFAKKAKELGFKVIDLEQKYKIHYSKNKKRFDFPNDGHWNEVGHSLIAEEIVSSLNLIKE